MPGRVVRVPVAVGDVVEAGQPLAVVEAMKMENEVTAQAPGVVSDVRTTAGDSVDAGAVLVVVTAGEQDG
jgi:biotin carboxyl carrier protein